MTTRAAKRLIEQYKFKWFWNKQKKQSDVRCFCGECFSSPTFGFIKYVDLHLPENAHDPNTVALDNSFIGIQRVPPENWHNYIYWNREEYGTLRTFYKDFENFEDLFESLKDSAQYHYRNKLTGQLCKTIKSCDNQSEYEEVVTKFWTGSPQEGLNVCPLCQKVSLIGKSHAAEPFWIKLKELICSRLFRVIGC